jgi:hypothetical protein
LLNFESDDFEIWFVGSFAQNPSSYHRWKILRSQSRNRTEGAFDAIATTLNEETAV